MPVIASRTAQRAAGNYRQAAGQLAEDRAAAFLESRGWQILLRNFRRRGGELDIIAHREQVLIIAEVRMRVRDDFGGAAASVDARKRGRIIRTAAALLQSRPALTGYRVRFDVLVVREGAIDWIEHAFTA
ncbi:MAG: YraN family protein [Steroidobacteraceae bacterium]